MEREVAKQVGINGRNAREDLLEIWRRFANALEPACLPAHLLWLPPSRDRDRTEPPNKPRSTDILHSNRHRQSPPSINTRQSPLTTSSSPTHLCTPAEMFSFGKLRYVHTNPARMVAIHMTVCPNRTGRNAHTPAFWASA
jgi:hypothetical protein